MATTCVCNTLATLFHFAFLQVQMMHCWQPRHNQMRANHQVLQGLDSMCPSAVMLMLMLMLQPFQSGGLTARHTLGQPSLKKKTI